MSRPRVGSTASTHQSTQLRIAPEHARHDNSESPVADDPWAIAALAARPPIARASTATAFPAPPPANTLAATRAKTPIINAATLRATALRRSQTPHKARSLHESALPSTSHH